MKTSKIVTEESVEPNDHPNVLAYRVGQVEKAVIGLESTTKEGFQEHNDKLDKIVNTFASKGDVVAISTRVTSLESDRKWLVRLVMGSVVFAVLALIGVGLKLN
jgi:hypothetical protein